MNSAKLALTVIAGGLALGCSSAPLGDGCSTSTDNTILFDPPLTALGHYSFAIEIGEETGECEVSLTEDGMDPGTCTPGSWAGLFNNEAGESDGDAVGWGTIKEIRGFLIGTAVEAEVSVTVVKDDVEVFDETLPLDPDAVQDSSCGEVERLLAVAEIPTE